MRPATNSNQGHCKNVVNFENLIETCISFGSSYNPTRESLKISALKDLLEKANENIRQLKQDEDDFLAVTNSRKSVFAPLKILSTRIVNALDASGASRDTVVKARVINRNLQGQQQQKNTIPAGFQAGIEENIGHSHSLHGYKEKAADLENLLKTVEKEPAYQPNEPALSIENIKKYFSQIQEANNSVAAVSERLHLTREARNELLYEPEAGLVTVAFGVKKYIRSVFTASSSEFKNANALKFRNRKVVHI